MITGIQIVLLFIIATLIIRTVKRHREGAMRTPVFAGWMGLWLVGVLVVLVPESTSRIAETLGVGRGVDAVVYVAMVVLFFLLFRLYGRTVAMEQEITTLVRKIALLEKNDDHEKKS